MKQKQTTLILILLLIVGSNGLFAQSPTAPAQGFNLFTQNGVTVRSSHSEGPVAVGGDLTILGDWAASNNTSGSFQVGGKNIGLLVKGKVNYTSGNTLQVNSNGYVKIGDSTGSKVWYYDQNNAATNIRITPGNNYNASPRIELNSNVNSLNLNLNNNDHRVFQNGLIDFAAAFNTMTSSSSSIAALSNNASITNSNGTAITFPYGTLPTQVKITLASGMNVLTLTAAQFNSITELSFNNNPSASQFLVINVLSGATFNWNVPNFSGIGADRGAFILINFPNALTLNVQGSGAVVGTIFAPFSDVFKVNSSNIDGQVIAKSFTQNSGASGELHSRVFTNSISVGSIPVVSTHPSSQSVCDATSVTFSAAASGTPTPTIQWQSSTNNGSSWTNISGATNSSYSFTPSTSNSNNQFRASFTNTAGTTNSNVATLTVFALPNVSISSQTNVSCFGGSNGAITVSASGGLSPYQYKYDGGSFQSSNVFSNLIAATQPIIVKDANNCSKTISSTITQPSAALGSSITSQTNALCYSNSTGSVTVAGSGGTTPYQYSINGTTFQSSGTFSSLSTNSYTVTVKDANNCTTTQGVTILPTTVLSHQVVSQSNIGCTTNLTGKVTIAGSGGTSPYQYKIGNGSYQSSGTFSSLAAGYYTLTVKDANNCLDTQTITITQLSSSLAASISSSTNVSCNGGSNGAATVLVTPSSIGSTFENGLTGWNIIGNASTQGVFGGIVPTQGASQGLIVSGAVSTTTVDNFLGLPLGTVSTTFPNTTAGSSFKRTITVNAGDTLYFDWNFVTEDYMPYNDVSFLSITGNSLIFLADVSTTTTSNNMTSNYFSFAHQTGYNTYSYVFTQAGTYTLGFGVFNRIDNVVASGLLIDKVRINSTLGSASNYTISWNSNPSQTTATAVNLSAGNYIVTASDSNGCAVTASTTISQPSTLTVSCSNTSASSYGATNATASVVANGGTAPYTYLWSNGSTSNSLSGLSTGTFSVNVTDSKGCVASCTTTLNNFTLAVWDVVSTNYNTSISGSVASNDIISADGGNVWSIVSSPTYGSLILTSNGGYSYSPNTNYYGSDSFIYQLCDANGDCDTAIVYITVIGAPVTPSISIVASTNNICNGTNVTFSATPVNGGNSPIYVWRKNGLIVGNNSSSYSDATLNNNDVVKVDMTSNHPLATISTVSSNSISINVISVPAQPSSFILFSDTIYLGQNSVPYSVTNVSGVTYSWNYSGSNVAITGSGNSIGLTPNQNATSGVLSVNASNSCGSSIPQTINVVFNPLITWTGGAGNNNWNHGGNWDAGSVPTDSSNVVIPSNTTNPPNVPSTTSVKDLYVAFGNELQIPNNSTLIVTGNLYNSGKISGGKLKMNGAAPQAIFGKGNVVNFELDNLNGATINLGDTLYISNSYLPTLGTLNTNGGLVLLSDSINGTATILAPQGTCSNYINGNVVVNKWIHGGRRAFRFLAHPFSSSIGLDQLTNDIDITGAGGSANGFTTTATNNPSAFWYNTLTGNGSSVDDNTGWIPFTNTNGVNENSWSPMQGARIYVRGQKGQGLGCTSCFPKEATLNMNGPVNMCDVTVNLQSNANIGYNFVGNPYPANIDMSLLTLGSSVGANFSVWDPNMGVYGAYVTQPFAYSYILPAYSSFMVTNSSNTNNYIQFTEQAKVSNLPTGNLFKTTTSNFGNESLHIRVTSNHDSIIWDRALLFFNRANSTRLEDKNDAIKLANAGLDFYTTTTDGKKLSVDFRPLVDGDIIGLGLVTDSLMNYTIQFVDYEPVAGIQLYLHDKYLNTNQLIVKGGQYDFNITNNAQSKAESRFEIRTGAVATSINDNNNREFEISIAPNPVVDQLTVSNLIANQDGVITVFDAIGNKINEIPTNGQKSLIISTQQYAQGCYFLHYLNGNAVQTVKFIKK